MLEMDSTPVIAGTALVAVFKAIAHALPNQVFEGDWFYGRDALLPAPIALGDFEPGAPCGRDVVFRIDELGDQFARTRARPMVRDGNGENSVRKCGRGGWDACFGERSVSAGDSQQEQYQRESEEDVEMERCHNACACRFSE